MKNRTEDMPETRDEAEEFNRKYNYFLGKFDAIKKGALPEKKQVLCGGLYDEIMLEKDKSIFGGLINKIRDYAFELYGESF